MPRSQTGPSASPRRARSPARNGSLPATKPKSPSAPPAKGKVAAPTAAAPAARSALHDIVLPLLLMLSTPTFCYVTAWLTAQTSPTLGTLVGAAGSDPSGFTAEVLSAVAPTATAGALLMGFMGLGVLLYAIPGEVKYGPLSEKGWRPAYADNAMAHCLLFPLLFVAGSTEVSGKYGLYHLSVLYDHFGPTVGLLNLGGLAFCLFLYAKGLGYLEPFGLGPSGPDCGSSGRGFIFDYYWGTELYPRLGGVDVKRFVNCRFSMTYWMLAGISFAAASFSQHGRLDPGIVLCAASQFLYLAKFFYWEIGYMRSIDIIIDRAGFYETWGCLVWVPTIYTLHTRTMVHLPSGLSWPAAGAIFVVGTAAVFFNFQADVQRQRFRETGGTALVWGRKPISIVATYTVVSAATGKAEQHTSLLLASGWWGVARHAQYLFELTAAWSWGLLAGVHTHGLLPLFYPAFLTVLLIHRAMRDEEKCQAKYGAAFTKYKEMVPYNILPGIF
mmetsp:Transcript_1792/g.5892  ORF Transcript_1792/g.5892 Transcript_1792/m.5892 type:complete len:499 (+) Transcript_1792:46-1542(+)